MNDPLALHQAEVPSKEVAAQEHEEAVAGARVSRVWPSNARRPLPYVTHGITEAELFVRRMVLARQGRTA